MIRKNNLGFSFIELSMVVFIFAILTSAVSVIASNAWKITQASITNERLDKVEKALVNYLIENQRLPCPAALNLDKTNTDFGDERVESNICDTTASGVFTSTSATTLVYGAVPIIALQLPPEYAYDGWKNKFSYVIDRRFTEVNNVDSSPSEVFTEGFARTSQSSVITIHDKNLQTITTDAIYVLVSHGENTLGSYKEVVRNDLPTVADQPDEEKNIYKAAFTSTFVDKPLEEDFDDFVRYKTKYEIARDAEWDDIGCVESELTTYIFRDAGNADKSITFPTSGNCTNGLCTYEGQMSSTLTCPTILENGVGENWEGYTTYHYFSKNPESLYKPTRECLKYGNWSDVLYGCVQGCTKGTLETELVTETVSTGIVSDDLDNYIEPNSWNKTGLGETALLQCDNVDKSGSIKIVCDSNGAGWTYTSGSGKCVDTNVLP